MKTNPRRRAQFPHVVVALAAMVAACGTEAASGDQAADAAVVDGTGGAGDVAADSGANGDSDAAGADDTASTSDTGSGTDTANAVDATSSGDAASADDGATDAVVDATNGSDAPDVAIDTADAVYDDAGNLLPCGKPCGDDELCQAGLCTKVSKPCGGPCANGLYCDEAAGTCQPTSCKKPVAFPNVQKVSYMQIAESSDGCDINKDGKPDNVFGKLLKVYPAANTELANSINESLFLFLLDAPAWDTTGKPFMVGAYLAEFAPASSGCSPTSPDANCQYTVDADNFAGSATGVCKTQALIGPVTGSVAGNDVAISGQSDPSQKMTIVLPVVGGLDFSMSGVSIEGKVAASDAWTSTFDGRICGVMTVVDFDKALASIPNEAWAQIGLDKDAIKTIIKAFLNPDIDLNGDGVPDALSVALRFKSVKGQIVGVIE